MTKDKLTTGSSANDILNKVNETIANKQNAKQEEDVLELIEEVKANEAPASNTTLQNGQLNGMHANTNSTNNKDDKGKNMTEKLVSENTAEETSALLKQLKDLTTKSVTDGLKFNSGTTVEEIVTELIKPQLSTWLDQHLPAIVKNVVEKEVKKLLPTED